MKKFIYLFSMLATFCYGQIHVIHEFDLSLPYLQDLSSSSLVIFDVDGVLSIPTNTYLTTRNFTCYRDSFIPYMNTLSAKEKDYYIG
ncbi:hypothetical protein K0U07_03205, partial [bacterium]|nr:hypothetical protein [bacterium]